MCCKCTETCRKLYLYGSGVFLIILGAFLIVFWPNLSQKIMASNFILKENSEVFDNWAKPPIPIYLELHLFNWTNPDQIRNSSVKPNFVEMGPYVFLEKRHKQNVTFHDNGETVSYYQKKTWFFDAEKSNGSLDDMLTAAHVITATVASSMRHRNVFIKKALNFVLNNEGGQLYVTRSVREWIFDGFQDKLIDFLHLFNSSSINIPFNKFGWLVGRNNSAEFDGNFTISTGLNNIHKLGEITLWNGKSKSGYYPTPCGIINGTTGDLFPPLINTSEKITIFAPDACRFLNLSPNGTIEKYNIKANIWIGNEETLGNGEQFPNHQCFCDPLDGDCPIKTGVVQCIKCRNSAPVFASFPHFYLADESYRNVITGMKPNASRHTFSLAIEPNTGIPLEVNAKLQINLLIKPDDDFDIYRGVPEFLMPMFWLEQKALLDEETANSAKLAMHLNDYGVYSGYLLVAFGGILIMVGILIFLAKRCTHLPEDDEEILTAEENSHN